MIYIFVEIKLLLILNVTRYSELIYNFPKYRFIQPIMARPGGFEPPTLGLEIRRSLFTNYSELHRFVSL